MGIWRSRRNWANLPGGGLRLINGKSTLGRRQFANQLLFVLALQVKSGISARKPSFTQGWSVNRRGNERCGYREACQSGVFSNSCFVGSQIDAVDFVVCDVALHPLNLWTDPPQRIAGILRRCSQLFRVDRPISGISLFITNFGIDVFSSHV